MKTSRRDFLKSIGASVAGSAIGMGAIPRASASAAPSNAPRTGKPLNVLFIMCDQHNAHAAGCYGGGFGPTPEMETPNLDRLADEGVMFTNSYCAQAQCCPSRYSMMTGQWPHTHGLRWNQIWEPRKSVTFPQLARMSGYKTATIGKHHFYWLFGNFDDLGFDMVVENAQYNAHCNRGGQRTYSNSNVNYRMSPMPNSLAATGYTYNSNEYHAVGYWTDRTIQYLRDRAADQEPFFAVYSFFLPHTPVLPTGPPGPPGTPMTPGEIDWARCRQTLTKQPPQPACSASKTTTTASAQTPTASMYPGRNGNRFLPIIMA